MSVRRPARPPHDDDPDPDGRVEQRQPRQTYYCRACRATAVAAAPRCPPRGWLMLTAIRRNLPKNPRDRYARLGVFCSTTCLAAAIPHVETIEATHTEGPTTDG